jgi:translation initiation factor IF-2
MAKTRAYKIAEELGIDRSELVEKAKLMGIELRSPMASLDAEQANTLREKLGGHAPGAEVVERRVEAAGGAAVIRRRKRLPKPAPAPEPKPEEIAPPLSVEPVSPVAVAPESPLAEAESGPELPASPVAELPTEGAPPLEAAAPTPVQEGESRERQAGERRDPIEIAAAPAKAKQRKRVREVVNLREQEQIARQVTGRMMRRPISVDPRSLMSPRRRRRDAPTRPAAATSKSKPTKRPLRIEGSVSVAELARLLGAKATEVQGRLMALGIMTSLTQLIDADTAGKVASEYGFELQDVGFREEEVLGPSEAATQKARQAPRPPVVTVMGHVDHGKTSLLDAIRKTNVVDGEAGGITQHIGAYQVAVGDRKITFIDTPGHEAFTTMRARGAQVTDIVVLVVAATEGIMPQTIEAIAHAKAAGVPILVAVNKCDLPGANSQAVRQRLMEHGLVPEEFGGDTICADVSAAKGTGIDQLLEMLLLQADVLELRADPERRAQGVVLEARLDRGRGPMATLLVQDGTLRRGDALVVGTCHGRARALEDDRGQRVQSAGPSVPVQLIGLTGVPEAGQAVHAVESERGARDVVAHRLEAERARPAQARAKLTLDDLFAQTQSEGPKELRVVLKADVHGSAEAVREALLKLSSEEVTLNVIHSGVGAISESDVMLAEASEAVVVGFHVRPDAAGRRAAEVAGVDVRAYRIIYELTDEIRKAMAGLLPPKVQENVLGQAEVRRVFNVPRAGTVAGCYVTEGLVRRNAQSRLIRDGVQVWEGRIGSLKRFKDDAREVQSGFECGIGLEGYNDVKVSDVIEAYEVEEAPASLE